MQNPTPAVPHNAAATPHQLTLTAAAETMLRALAADPAYDVYTRNRRRLQVAAFCGTEHFMRSLPAREALHLVKHLARWLRRHRMAHPWHIRLVDEHTGACCKHMAHVPHQHNDGQDQVARIRKPFVWLRRAARHSSVFKRGGLRERTLPTATHTAN